MPAGVVLAIAADADPLRALLESLKSRERAFHVALIANNPDQVLHHLLEFFLNLIGRFWRGTIGALEWLKRSAACRFDLLIVDFSLALLLCELGSVCTGSFSEYQQVRERVPAQPVRAVQPRPALAGCEKSGHRRHL